MINRLTRRQALFAGVGAVAACASESNARVSLYRVPAGGLQPQTAIDDQGILHLVYYAGDPHHGDIFYVYSKDGGATFSTALRVNSRVGSAIAAGTIRGAQLAIGKDGRVHVAWNGSSSGKTGAPMLYARLNDAGSAFEPERNLMLHSFGLDGGGSVAADRAGNVYVAWHGIGESEARGPLEGEARRQVWITKSEDNGRTFSREQKAWTQATGACGCCGMKIFADRQGDVSALYRSATESIHRDIYLLTSKDHAKTFQGGMLQEWNINACPMSSMDIAENGAMTVGAWETGGQVWWARLDRGSPRASFLVQAPGEGKGRKHPRVAVNRNGDVLLVWTEGTGWQKGGSLAYQIFGTGGQPKLDTQRLPDIPTWSFAAAVARPDNTFSILY